MRRDGSTERRHIHGEVTSDTSHVTYSAMLHHDRRCAISRRHARAMPATAYRASAEYRRQYSRRNDIAEGKFVIANA